MAFIFRNLFTFYRCLRGLIKLYCIFAHPLNSFWAFTICFKTSINYNPENSIQPNPKVVWKSSDNISCVLVRHDWRSLLSKVRPNLMDDKIDRLVGESIDRLLPIHHVCVWLVHLHFMLHFDSAVINMIVCRNA